MFGEYIGPVVRQIKIDSEKYHDVVVIGDAQSLHRSWKALLPRDTLFIHRHFVEIPSARKYVCIGAGYNLVWEMHQLRVDVVHIPIHKRYDDQFHRVGLLNRIVYDRQQFKNFLDFDCFET